jgi:cytochrome c2
MTARCVSLLVLLSLFGCSSSGGCGSEPAADTQPTPAEPTQAAEPSAPVVPPLEGLMREHYQKAYDAREALIRGDIASAKVAMKFLAEHQQGAALPENLRPALAEMQRAAHSFDAATGMREAGEALAGTFARCGLCHKAAGKGPEIASTPLPEGNDASGHMRRHHWAAQEMWAGLVTASDERFLAGAKALEEKAIGAETLGGSDLPAEDVARLDAHIHSLASSALAASDLRSRAESYARLLATCGTCHKLMKRGPQPLGEVEPVPAE